MGICWSEPPPPQHATTIRTTYQSCVSCGVIRNSLTMSNQWCEDCLRKTQQQQYHYTYATMPQPQPQPQQQYYMQQPQQYYPQQPQQYYPQPQQRQQIGTGTALVGGFVLGAMLETMLDPSD